MAIAEAYLTDIIRTYRYYKQLGDPALAQVSDAGLHAPAWDRAGVWTHGDLMDGNLLVRHGIDASDRVVINPKPELDAGKVVKVLAEESAQ